MTFMAWPEIEGFHNIRKFIRVDPGEWWHKKELFSGTSEVVYRAKVKLHGTNAAVQCLADGSIVCQSRENIISPEKDNAGFARWVKENEKFWKDTHNNARAQVIIYGEWIGPGIQRNVAVSQIPKKAFAVFAARPLDANNNPLDDTLWVEPDVLTEIVQGIPDVYVLPWYSRPVMHGSDTRITNILTVDWKKTDEDLKQIIAPVNSWIDEIEANDPWVEETFGVKGTGEGLVFYPCSEAHKNSFESFTNLCFKAKGEKHKNIATAKPVQVSAEAAASIEAFVEMVVTHSRLEQGATKVSPGGALTYDLKNTGKFVSWVSADVEKETQDELAASGLTFKQVQKAVSDKARAWYIAKAKE